MKPKPGLRCLPRRPPLRLRGSPASRQPRSRAPVPSSPPAAAAPHRPSQLLRGSCAFPQPPVSIPGFSFGSATGPRPRGGRGWRWRWWWRRRPGRAGPGERPPHGSGTPRRGEKGGPGAVPVPSGGEEASRPSEASSRCPPVPPGGWGGAPVGAPRAPVVGAGTAKGVWHRPVRGTRPLLVPFLWPKLVLEARNVLSRTQHTHWDHPS